MIATTNPATGEVVRKYDAHSAAYVDTTLEKAHTTFLKWRASTFAERAALLRSLANVLRAKKDELARLSALEMGKVLSEGRTEIEKCAGACEYFAEHSPAFLADQPMPSDFSKSYVSFQPLGVVLAVMPWNFPFWQVLRAAAPAIMAGNTMVLKHASNTPAVALMLEALFKEAGAPEGIFSTLLIPGSDVARVIAHPAVRAVTLTGSTPAGRAIASAAGQHLKKSVLELGGSDAYIVLEDADIADAAKRMAAGRFLNCGQSCISVKRMIVVGKAYDAFEAAMRAEVAKLVVGDPLADGVTTGPMSRVDLRDELHAQVQASVDAGARVLVGGVVPAGKGAYYPATLLTDVKPGMPAYHDELFGPVAVLIRAHDEAEALWIANDSPFGLGGGIFTQNIASGERVAREQIEAGCAYVNACVRSDPRLPFGGVKDSGYGRELSVFGIREFVNVKTVAVL